MMHDRTWCPLLVANSVGVDCSNSRRARVSRGCLGVQGLALLQLRAVVFSLFRGSTWVVLRHMQCCKLQLSYRRRQLNFQVRTSSYPFLPLDLFPFRPASLKCLPHATGQTNQLTDLPHGILLTAFSSDFISFLAWSRFFPRVHSSPLRDSFWSTV